MAQAQDAVNSIVQSNQVTPQSPGEQAQKENQIPFNPQDYVPVPMPAVSGVHTGPVYAVTYDVASGIETVHDLQTGLASEGWIAGRELTDEVQENLIRSFSSLSSITSSVYPWSAQSRMFFTQTGGNFLCSGTMVDARMMITAGHCVHEGSGGSWSTGVSISPAWDGDDDAFGSSSASLLGSFTDWTNSSSWDGDMGFVRIDRPVGFLTGWFGYGWNSDNGWWSSTTWNMAGYPGSCFSGAPDQLYYGWGSWDLVGTYVVEADMSESCWFGGMSGSGVYHIDNGSRYVRANVSHGWGFPFSTTRMGSVRMTEGKFNFLRDTMIDGAYNTTQVDYTPMRVDLAGGQSSIIRAGESVSYNYLVYNTSNYNPASTSVDVDVYLSSNDFISTFDTKIQDHFFTWDFAAKSGVQVNATSTIPLDHTPGSYWLGIIIDETDYRTTDNDSSGWDAQPITVDEPLNSITMTGPTSAPTGTNVTYDITDAPTSATMYMYWSRFLTGSTISNHPFSIGSPYNLVETGTSSISGTWSVTGPVPSSMAGVTIYLEVRAEKNGYTYDSNYISLTGL